MASHDPARLELGPVERDILHYTAVIVACVNINEVKRVIWENGGHLGCVVAIHYDLGQEWLDIVESELVVVLLTLRIFVAQIHIILLLCLLKDRTYADIRLNAMRTKESLGL